mmetsp:Transcript_52826/g.114707  ORF Transcript_52826/g.114707 Transcript_52826/m.114707 type:complete len:463 (+) Transcript_52826:23-1411(+)
MARPPRRAIALVVAATCALLAVGTMIIAFTEQSDAQSVLASKDWSKPDADWEKWISTSSDKNNLADAKSLPSMPKSSSADKNKLSSGWKQWISPRTTSTPLSWHHTFAHQCANLDHLHGQAYGDAAYWHRWYLHHYHNLHDDPYFSAGVSHTVSSTPVHIHHGYLHHYSWYHPYAWYHRVHRWCHHAVNWWAHHKACWHHGHHCSFWDPIYSTERHIAWRVLHKWDTYKLPCQEPGQWTTQATQPWTTPATHPPHTRAAPPHATAAVTTATIPATTQPAVASTLATTLKPNTEPAMPTLATDTRRTFAPIPTYTAPPTAGPTVPATTAMTTPGTTRRTFPPVETLPTDTQATRGGTTPMTTPMTPQPIKQKITYKTIWGNDPWGFSKASKGAASGHASAKSAGYPSSGKYAHLADRASSASASSGRGRARTTTYPTDIPTIFDNAADAHHTPPTANKGAANK